QLVGDQVGAVVQAEPDPLVAVGGDDLPAEVEPHPAVPQPFGDQLTGDVLGAGEQPVPADDEVDLAAQTAETGGELAGDDPAAHDDQPFRHGAGADRLPAGPSTDAPEVGRHRGFAAGAQRHSM